MKSPICKVVGFASWIITAIVAVSIGLTPLLGYNFLASFIAGYPKLIMPAYYIVGIAGAWSLVMFFKMVSMGGCCSDNCHTK
jgi:uncharacterized membrane protein YuzA (DUF378 family)